MCKCLTRNGTQILGFLIHSLSLQGGGNGGGGGGGRKGVTDGGGNNWWREWPKWPVAEAMLVAIVSSLLTYFFVQQLQSREKTSTDVSKKNHAAYQEEAHEEVRSGGVSKARRR